MAGMAKEVNQLLKQLQRLGCDVEQLRGGHWRVSREGCPSITVAKSPSDSRTLLNIKADIRRCFGIRL